MSTKVQPANDAGNDASDADVIDPGERLSRRHLSALHRDCVQRRETYLAARYSERATVVVHHDNLPANVRGPVREGCIWTDLGPVEHALTIMASELELAVHTASTDPTTQRELAVVIIEAARSLTAHRTPSFALEKPTPSDVCALFDVAQRAVRRGVANGRTHSDAVRRVAFSVAYLRAKHRLNNETSEAVNSGREPVVSHIAAEQPEFAQRFERALEEYLRSSSANARAMAMFKHFDTTEWVGDEALRKALRKRVSRMGEFKRAAALRDLLYYADRADEMDSPVALWARVRAGFVGQSER